MWAASVAVVSDRVFPEAALPNAAFGAALAGWGAVFGGGVLFGEVFFQGAPLGGVIVFAGWEGPDTVDVVWEDDAGVSVEGGAGACVADGLAEGGDLGGEALGLAVE